MYEHKSNRVTHYILIYTRAYWHFKHNTIVRMFCILKVNTVCGWLRLDEWVAQLWLMTTSLVPTYTGHTDNHSTLSEQAHTHIHLRTFTQTEVIAGFSWIQWMNTCVGQCCPCQHCTMVCDFHSSADALQAYSKSECFSIDALYFKSGISFRFRVTSEDCVRFSCETCI